MLMRKTIIIIILHNIYQAKYKRNNTTKIGIFQLISILKYLLCYLTQYYCRVNVYHHNIDTQQTPHWVF